MAKLFIGIALALMIATASVGFLAKGNIDKLQSSWKGARNDLHREQANVQTAKAELKKSAEDLALANDKVKETNVALEAKTMEVAAKEQLLSTAQKEVETQIAEVDRLKKLVAAQPVAPVAPGGPTPEFVALTAQYQKALADLADVRKDADAKGEQLKANEVKLAELLARERRRETAFGAAGLQGKILAVNPGWNFVVVSVGDSQGVAVNSSLLVVRGNAPIARLRITSVESSKSIADVIPGSVAHGLVVLPGDTVIFEGRTSATELTKPAKESEAPAVASPRST